MAKIGIIGGSGLYEIEALKDRQRLRVETPFGAPSEEFLLGRIEDKEVVFLSRHGRGHRIFPTAINYRANIYGMKKLGVERVISISACGSLKKEIKPLDFVIPDQFVDRTNQARKNTFFDEGVTVHINFAHPVCKDLARLVYEAAKQVGVTVHPGGTYLNIEGPQFSTFAESNLYRQWGMDIIGMTNMLEARLAREAEICYVTLAAVTDYDCWYQAHNSVSVEMILDNLRKNIENSKKILKRLFSILPGERNCECKEALKNAIVTDPQLIPQEIKDRLSLLLGKYIK